MPVSSILASTAVSTLIARVRAQVFLAEVSYTFWSDLRLLHARLGNELGPGHPALRTAARALRAARLAQRLGRGRWAMRRLEAARSLLLHSSASVQAANVQAELSGHLEALPHIWNYVMTGPR